MKKTTETVGVANVKMNHFIGTKEVLAKLMNLGDYNIYRGWEIPSDESPKRAGYLVEYLDSPDEKMPHGHKNYISWSPKDVFERSYKTTGESADPESTRKINLTFGQAISALKNGKRVQRKGWNGKGMFVFMQVPAAVGMEYVGKMTSLPQSVKDGFEERFSTVRDGDENEFTSIEYSNQLALVHPNNSITSWSPSTTDVLSEDWIILH